MIELKECNLCHSKDLREIYRKKYDEFFNTINKDIRLIAAACKNCGFIFLKIQPNEKDLKSMYENQAKGKISLGLLNKLNEYHTKRAIHRLNWIKKEVNIKGQKILDIGCSNGIFVKMAKEEGMIPLGIEQVKVLADYARRNYKLNIINNSFESTKLKKENFDFISMFHALEHFRDPKATLMRINIFLKNGGYAYIAVPNIYKSGNRFCDIFGGTHFNYFSPKTLEHLLKITGFRVIKKETIGNEIRILGKKTNHHISKIKTEDYKKVVLILGLKHLLYFMPIKIKKTIVKVTSHSQKA